MNWDSDEKREGKELLRFATRAGANSDTLKKLAFLSDFSSRSSLRKLKGQIVDGGMEELFPTEKIIMRNGESALGVSEYLGKRRVGLCVHAALHNKNVDEKEGAEEYLRWAAKNGAPGIRERALAGLAIVAGEKLKEGGNIFIRSSMLAADKSAKVLRRELGRDTADDVLERQRKGGKTELWAVSTISLCMGAGVASGLPFLKGMAEGRLEPRYAAAFLAAATVAFIAVEISKARALAFLAKRIGGMLEKKADTGQL